MKLATFLFLMVGYVATAILLIDGHHVNECINCGLTGYKETIYRYIYSGATDSVEHFYWRTYTPKIQLPVPKDLQ